jgi:hypothetical protein
MRFLLPLFALAAGLAVPTEADAQNWPRFREAQQQAQRGVREGDILPLHVIRERIRIPNAQFIGADLIADGTRYRLRFMRGVDVIWVDVDARTGRILGYAGN